MHPDITPVLDGWSFKPDDVTARIVTAADGTPRLQMRLELGLMEMALDGRPDGKRPNGSESMLDYCELVAAVDPDFELDEELCIELEAEGVFYYYRYLCLFQLGDYERVARDTARNLRLFDFVREHTSDPDVQWAFEQYRPYVMMMNVRARASSSLAAGDVERAVAQIQETIDQIESFFAACDNEEAAEECQGLSFLREWLAEIRTHRPDPSTDHIERLLRKAVETENYELAARLRDQLRGNG